MEEQIVFYARESYLALCVNNKEFIRVQISYVKLLTMTYTRIALWVTKLRFKISQMIAVYAIVGSFFISLLTD